MENNLNKNLNYKFIVYETINTVNNYVYIGVHKTLTPYEFDGYIGNGVYINKPCTYEKSKTKFQQAVKEFGPKSFKRFTQAVFDDEDAAYDLEEQLVNCEFLARPDIYNMVLGGKFGVPMNVKVYQYDITGKFISEYDSMLEASKHINRHYTAIGHAISKKARAGGFYWNTDKVEKIDLNDYFNPERTYHNIYRYLLDGSYDDMYENGRLAAEATNCCDKTIYSACILGNIVKSKYYFSYVKSDNYSYARSEYIKIVPVHKYDSNGVYVCSYDTLTEAWHENKTNIIKSIKLKQADEKGNIWGLVKLEYYNRPKLPQTKRKIGRFDLAGNMLEEFDSATKAANDWGSAVWHNLSGRNETHKGFIFRYLS
jgi:hypothetical protein